MAKKRTAPADQAAERAPVVWAASGRVAETDGNVSLGGLTWTPGFDELDETALNQADFLRDALEEAFALGLVQGEVVVNFAGREPTDDDADRGFLTFAVTPYTPAPESPPDLPVAADEDELAAQKAAG